MSLRTRLDAPGTVHHVISRGIDRHEIFLDAHDRNAYLDSLRAAFTRSSIAVLAWALMPNHVHLLARTSSCPLHQGMQMLGTRYAINFNRRHGRSGYVFEGRYRSFLVDTDEYVLTAIRYIHRNPIASGLVPSVRELARYPWSGHAALMGGPASGFQLVGPVLELFGTEPGVARTRLSAWMEEPGGSEYGVYEARLAGSPAVDKARRAVQSTGDQLHPRGGIGGEDAESALRVASWDDAAALARRRQRWDAAAVLSMVACRLGVDPVQVSDGRRTRRASRVRAAVAYLARRDLDLGATSLSKVLGATPSALTHAHERGRAIVEEAGLRLE